jgi:ELWxxDGT repeat protein
MNPTLTLVAIGLIAAVLPGQHRVATNVGGIIGTSTSSVWFVASGRIHVADGRGSVRDTGISPVRVVQRGEELFTYPGDRIHAIDAHGDVITRFTPVPFPAANPGVGWQVWSGFVSTPHAEIIERWDWNGTAWDRSRSGVSSPSSYPQIEHVEVQRDRYLVLWSDESTGTVDLLDGSRHIGTGTGICSQIWRWSRGILTCAEDGQGSDAFAWFEELGPEGDTPTPVSWGWGGYQFDVREATPGFPWVESWLVPEFIPFLIGDTPYPLPGETTHGFFWAAGGAVLVAEASTASVRRIVHYDGVAWSPITALLGMRDVSPVGDFGGRTVMAARDPATAFAVVAFDPVIGRAEVVLDRLATQPGRGVPFAGGILFAADDGIHGRELWFSRGAAGSTWMVADLAPGSQGADPADLRVIGSRAVFVASDSTGRHLFVLDERELDWRRSPVDGRFYRLSEPGTWSEVDREARRQGGLLATVRGAAEQGWLWRMFGPQDLWIGLEDFDLDGIYTWRSGEPLGFTAWCPGEPGTNPPGEVAVHMANYPGFCEGGWNNQDPNDRYRGIIERAARPTAVEEYGSGCEGTSLYCASYGPVLSDNYSCALTTTRTAHPLRPDSA